MSTRLLLAIVAVVGVPAVLVGYITLVEGALGLAPDKLRGRIRPWLWVAPALAFLGVFLIYPTINTIYISFMSADSSKYVGLDNYRHVFTDPAIRNTLRNNVLWLVLLTLLTMTFGLLVAVLTDRVPYESAAKAIIFLPMAVSFVAAGVIWRFMYDYRPPGAPQTGTVNAVLTTVIPGMDPRAWLVNQPGNNVALIIAAVWSWTGFAAVVLSAGLKGIPTDVQEAARVDGANEWQNFWRITVPMMAPTIAVVTTMMVITALKAFDIVYVMTSGNYNTEVIASRMYKEMFNFRNFGRASALAVILLLAIVPVMALNLKRFREQEATR
jgi:alpha-glucoside transport system permease protein